VEGSQGDTAKPEEHAVRLNEPSDWVERMAVVSLRPLPDTLDPNDDPKREDVFIHHTIVSVVRGLDLLERASVPWQRPQDFYAEMFKDDVHMSRVRESIEKEKQRLVARAQRRVVKDQKKFGKEVQAEALRQKAKYKQQVTSKLAEWKKKRQDNSRESLDEVVGDGEGQRGGKGGMRRKGAMKSIKPGGAKRQGKNARRRH